MFRRRTNVLKSIRSTRVGRHALGRQALLAASCTVWLLFAADDLTSRPVASVAKAADEETHREQDIYDAWRKREQDIEMFRFTWEEQQTLGHDPGIMSATETQATDTVSRVLTLTVQGNKVATSNEIVESSSGSWLREHNTSFDGGEGQTFFGGNDKPSGSIAEMKQGPEQGSLSVYPLLLALRPLHSMRDCIDPRRCRLQPGGGTVEGRSCMFLIEELPGPKRPFYWVCPELDFSIVRCVTEIDGKQDKQLDISYTRDSEGRYVPAAWNVVWVNPESGRLVQAGESKVTDYSINEDISESEFQLKFPPRTIVNNKIDNQNYFVMSDGSMRVIQPHEAGLSRKELASRYGDSGSWVPTRRVTMTVLAVFIPLAFGLWVLLLRRRVPRP